MNVNHAASSRPIPYQRRYASMTNTVALGKVQEHQTPFKPPADGEPVEPVSTGNDVGASDGAPNDVAPEAVAATVADSLSGYPNAISRGKGHKVGLLRRLVSEGGNSGAVQQVLARYLENHPVPRPELAALETAPMHAPEIAAPPLDTAEVVDDETGSTPAQPTDEIGQGMDVSL